MKKMILTMSLALVAALGAGAQNYHRYGITNIGVTRPVDDKVCVSMNVDPKDAGLKYTRMITVTPTIVSADNSHSAKLQSFTLAGKNAYMDQLRQGGLPNLYRAGHDSSFAYSSEVAWEPWMEKSRLVFDCTEGCCGSENVFPLAMADLDFSAPSFTPVYEYVQPAAVDSKLFNLEGKAFISFAVGKSVINPDYMNNPEELKKILGTIDAVRDNKDAKVKKISLCGYASPEGAYATNERLAKARTIALKDYVRKQYAFPEDLFETSSVAEDWAGLREAVQKSDLADAREIVEFIDSDYPVAKRNDQLRKLFPASYQYLLKNVYPGLRHTDYVVNYEVRKYTDVSEIKQVMKTNPQNLSLNEFFLAAKSYKVGSPEYNEVFDIAARVYPDDPVANVNAAIAAMNRGDLSAAQKFLDRAGNSSDANYARGLLAAKQGDYAKATSFLKGCGNPQAKDALSQIEAIQNYKGAVEWLMK